MKSSTLHTLMMSAYLSAMLVSSTSPLHRTGVTLAIMANPAAATEALRSAISGLRNDSWAPSTTQETPVSTPVALEAAPMSDKDGKMTSELMARLSKRALASKKEAFVEKEICQAFGISDGSKNLSARKISNPTPEGKHSISVLADDHKQIIIGFQYKNVSELYWVNLDGSLRAAVIYDESGVRPITNEQAAAKFATELKIFVEIAENLPPSDNNT